MIINIYDAGIYIYIYINLKGYFNKFLGPPMPGRVTGVFQQLLHVICSSVFFALVGEQQ